jgi:hypothetical protein
VNIRYIWIGVIWLSVINIVIWLSNNVDVRTGERIKNENNRTDSRSSEDDIKYKEVDLRAI